MSPQSSAIDLKSLRTQANLQQTQLAELLEVDQSQISRWERSPDTIPLHVVVSLSKVLGLTVEQLLTGTKMKSELVPDVELGQHQKLEQFAHSMTAVGDSWPGLAQRAINGGVKGPAEVHRFIDGVMRKPRVLVVGPFDGGKSTFVNTLLQNRTLPVRYQPTTSLVTVLRHVDDRPAWMGELMTDWLAQNIGRQNKPAVMILSEGFDIENFDDEEHVQQHYLTAGDLDLLATIGSHGPGACLPDATHAVVFLDAEILKVCDLVDTPGNDASDDDDLLAHSAKTIAHVLVQLNPTTGFMSASQISYLLPGIRSLTPYFETPAIDRVFIVASHAHGGISDEEVHKILDGGAARLATAMQGDVDALVDTHADARHDLEPAGHGGVLTATAPWTPERIRERMFSFYDSNGRGGSRGEPLLAELMDLVGVQLPRMALEHLAEQLASTAQGYVGSLEQQVTALDAAEQASEEHPDVEQASGQVLEEVDKARANLTDAIERHRQRSHRALEDALTHRLDPERVEKLIRDTYSPEAFKRIGREAENPKKTAEQEVGALVVSQLQNDLAKILERESKTFGRTVDSELDELTRSIHQIGLASGIEVVPFDLRGAFVGAALSSAAVGALAVWASTLGNLGAYIIAAQAAGWLSAIGISLPAGGATMTAAMAALGGPVGVAVAIIAIGVFVGLMFRSDWQKRLARAVVKGFNKPNKRGKTIRGALDDAITQYWTETQHAVEAGLDNVVQERRSEVQRYRGLIGDDTTSITRRQERRELLADLRQYFSELLTVITISRRQA